MREAARTRVWAALWLRYLGVFLLGLTFFLSWYAVTATQSGYGTSVTQTFSAVSTSVSATWYGAPPAQPTPYDQADLPATGSLYEVVVGLVLAAATLGIAITAISNPGRARSRSRIVVALSIAAVALALAASVLLVAAQPAAVCSDARHFPLPLGYAGGGGSYSHPECNWQFKDGNNGWYNPGLATGPQSSFVGSASSSTGNMTWGPGPALYLCVGGAVLLASGQVLEFGRPKLAEVRQGPAGS